MVNCFEVVPTDSKQVLDRTVNREKRLSLCASDRFRNGNRLVTCHSSSQRSVTRFVASCRQPR